MGVQNFKPTSSLLAVQWPKNQLRVIKSLLNAIFGIANCRTTKWMPFLESKDKTWQDRYIFKRKIWVSIFYIFVWPAFDLTFGQMWKWVSPSNSTDQMIYKTCAIGHSCYIFMRWPHLTWPSPWPSLSTSLLFTWHLRHPFTSVAFSQSSDLQLSLVWSLQLIRRKCQPWPLPDLDPAFDLAKKILKLHWNPLAESFRSPPRAPRSASFGS